MSLGMTPSQPRRDQLGPRCTKANAFPDESLLESALECHPSQDPNSPLRFFKEPKTMSVPEPGPLVVISSSAHTPPQASPQEETSPGRPDIAIP